MRTRLLLTCALALGACNGSSTSSTAAVIDASGGTLALDHGTGSGARLDVPPGAVDVATSFTITASTTADSLPANTHADGAMITFAPEGQRFATPVRIVIAAASQPMVLLTRPHGGGGAWARVDGAVWDVESGTISAQVMHFSDFLPVLPDTLPRDAGPLACTPSGSTETHCADGIDDDCDGAIDCLDRDCGADPACGTTCAPAERLCADGLDDDCDGNIDCADTDCRFDPACGSTTCTARSASELYCSDGIDDDCDGAIDCADPDCASDPICGTSCAASETHCADGLDDDCDGAIDCADVDCAADPACHVASTCDVLAGTGCAAGMHCVLHSGSSLVDSYAVAVCMASGAGAEGSTCASGGDCAAGLSCAAISGTSSDPAEATHYYFTTFEGFFSRGGGMCTHICAGGDWTASSCASGQICHEIDGAGTPSGMGACYAPRG